MNKVVYVGVYLRPVFIVLAHVNTTPRGGRDIPTQTITPTPSQPVSLKLLCAERLAEQQNLKF